MLILWIIFIIWLIFAIACGILTETTGNELFSVMFIITLPIMFYVPFFFI